MSAAPGTLAEQMPLSARVAGFMAHLRLNGMPVGPAESESALAFLARTPWQSVAQLRHGLRILLTGNKAEWQRFDELFEAYWMGRGRARAAPAPATREGAPSRAASRLWSDHLGGDLPERGAHTGDGAQPGGADGAPATHQARTRVAAHEESLP